jgi:hypothetical protein
MEGSCAVVVRRALAHDIAATLGNLDCFVE